MNHWVQNKSRVKFVKIRNEIIPNLGCARAPEREKWVREPGQKGVGQSADGSNCKNRMCGLIFSAISEMFYLIWTKHSAKCDCV
jgi:hypothetical protein